MIFNRARHCPACGGETMRTLMPLLLKPFAVLLGERCSFRWCRKCTRRWLAFHPRRRTSAQVEGATRATR